MDLKQISGYIERLIMDTNVTEAAWEISEHETREFTADSGGFTLYRTDFGTSYSLTVILNGRRSSAEGTDLGQEALRAAVENVIASAAEAEEDPANMIAPGQGTHVFRHGDFEADEGSLFERARELCEELRTNHPQIALNLLTADHRKKHSIYKNTNGSSFESFTGRYALSLEIAGNDGTNTTGLDYSSFTCADLALPFIHCGSIAEHIRAAEEQLRQTELKGKFRGTVIFTPECLAQMLAFLTESYLADRVVLDGSGLWNGRIGEMVASEKLSFGFLHSDGRLIGGSDYTADGYLTADLPVIENGVLRNQQLSLYTANKTGREPSRNDGFELVVKPGNTALADMIAETKHGLLVGGFSGGEPGTNGEFSGVAKNSFLVEDGRIIGAVSETMISGNLAAMLSCVSAISRETCSDGSFFAPYIAVEDIVISGSGR